VYLALIKTYNNGSTHVCIIMHRDKLMDAKTVTALNTDDYPELVAILCILSLVLWGSMAV
jgi:hypothetical protein